MADINIDGDLEQVNKQLETLVGQLNATNTQRDQLTQQIHNLNGIAMYLRGKQNADSDAIPDVSQIEIEPIQDD
jgi:peptidoglycan hydrolase CwlO-like protein|tara:strand:+ start:346 stop:567 length:222 start_codon:yes stop_codon:yes gene_type:complete